MRVLSLGAGVQSTTLLLMAVSGELEPLDAAVFADTGWEPAHVYAHLGRLEAAAPGLIQRVSNGNIRDDVLSSQFRAIPYHIRYASGEVTIGQRQCTGDYKLRPVRRRIRELLPKGAVCELWIGFSTDEIGRVSDNMPRYLRPRYPLIEAGLDRTACQQWLQEHGWASVAKSACIGCPYNDNRTWRALRDRPGEWAEAVAFDEAIRHSPRLPPGATAYLHRSCLPLTEAPITNLTRTERREALQRILPGYRGERREVLEMYAAGLTLDQIAARTPYSAPTAHRVIRKALGAEDAAGGCSPFGCRSDSVTP